ncbi:MAG: hypothetical protein FJ087_13515 [Deltaproteobacteria bacterium]|nr:hypothetical protein [Deltaproteobacteria bacterium]
MHRRSFGILGAVLLALSAGCEMEDKSTTDVPAAPEDAPCCQDSGGDDGSCPALSACAAQPTAAPIRYGAELVVRNGDPGVCRLYLEDYKAGGYCK